MEQDLGPVAGRVGGMLGNGPEKDPKRKVMALGISRSPARVELKLK